MVSSPISNRENRKTNLEKVKRSFLSLGTFLSVSPTPVVKKDTVISAHQQFDSCKTIQEINFLTKPFTAIELITEIGHSRALRKEVSYSPETFSVSPQDLGHTKIRIQLSSELICLSDRHGSIIDDGFEGMASTMSESIIEKYFSFDPDTRAEKRETIKDFIRSSNDVFTVLEYGHRKGIVDAYDGVVDLLAECNKKTIIDALNVAKHCFIDIEDVDLRQRWERNWDLLIRSLTCSLNIKPQEKLSLLMPLVLLRDKISRFVKMALIDSVVELEIEDAVTAKAIIGIFASPSETDNVVREYAIEQSAECL